nr:OmpH family outer membrane protein [Allomuricauda sp.]
MTKTIYTGLFFFALALVFFLFLSGKSEDQNRIAYVNNVQLFDSFNMAQDIDRMHMVEINKQKKKLDSLYQLYNLYRQSKKTEVTAELEGELRTEDQKLKQMSESFSMELNKQVWERLNQYIKAYGNENGYDLIMGTQGNGNVMYAKEHMDLTSNLIQYCNTKYEGD